MNITQALNVALPEMPAKMMGQRYPRIHPEVVFKEHVEEGQLLVKAVVPGIDAMYSFPPESWKLIQLFDGQRSYEEIADIYSQQTGVLYSAETIRDFAADIDSMNFWYKTAQEKNIKLMQRSAEERRKLLQKKNQWGDLSLIKFPAFNPDGFLTSLYRYCRFMYTGWFTVATLVAFAFTLWIFFTHWGEIGYDTLRFYNFAEKTWGDVAFFWIVGCILLCIHEIGHGLTCKHYGARVPAMGFLLIYLTPAFYTDTTEGEVRSSQYQRLMIAVAGVWSELILCAIVTPIWWATPPGTWVHDWAYTIILFTGIAVVFINWNPLMKLDGYYILCDLLGIQDLKENSTLYLSAWVKRHVWRLPVEVPYVPKRRRLGFAVYAALSGLYSYSVLYVFASFIGNIFRNFNPEWAFVPEFGTAYLIFRGRIRTLWNFTKFVYLDKKDRVLAWFTRRRRVIVFATIAALLILPIFPESAVGRFVLEPENSAVVRAQVPGVVVGVYAAEGQQVDVGTQLVQLRNLDLESELARTTAEHQAATARATSELLRYGNFGAAATHRSETIQRLRGAQDVTALQRVQSPLRGVVVTPRLMDLLGAYVPTGTELAQVVDLSLLRARMYVSEHDLRRFPVGGSARLQVEGMFGKIEARSVRLAPDSTHVAPGLIDESKYAGQRPPVFYTIDLIVPNGDGRLMPGMVGTARVYGERKSLVRVAWQEIAGLVRRKIW